jgi:hypothetical protein
MGNREETVRSLNATALPQMSVEELESRLQMEELDPRGEMWTGCGCADVCGGQWDPSHDCPGYLCFYKGTW